MSTKRLIYCQRWNQVHFRPRRVFLCFAGTPRTAVMAYKSLRFGISDVVCKRRALPTGLWSADDLGPRLFRVPDLCGHVRVCYMLALTRCRFTSRRFPSASIIASDPFHSPIHSALSAQRHTALPLKPQNSQRDSHRARHQNAWQNKTKI